MPPIDKLLSQYSAPVRSWPGEEWMDEEARANYAAANPPKLQTEGGSIDKGDLLPIVRYPTEAKSPSDWTSSSDVMKQLDDGWRVEPFSRLTAPFKSMAEAWRTQPILGPMVRPSQMHPEVFNQMSSDAMTVAGTGMTGGIGRVAAGTSLPAGTAELGIFGGRKARTADLDALARAEEMTRLGAPREDVWSQTGWFTGPDGKWRFEIDDSAMKPVVGMRDWINRENGVTMAPHIGAAYEKAASELTPNAPVRMKRLYDHPELDQAYPHGFTSTPEHQSVMGLPVQLIEGGSASGFYSPDGWKGRPSIGIHETLPPGPARETALHELQHAIQDREGFATGISPHNPEFRDYARQVAQEVNERYRPELDRLGREGKWDEVAALDDLRRAEVDRVFADDKLGIVGGMLGYRRSAGEAEARAVQARRDLTPEQRRADPPWNYYDVPEADQIVRFGSGEGAMSNKPLDMSPEARLARAREMGFDTDQVWYHGTEKAGFPAFDETLSGTNAGKESVGIFLTENRRGAQTYAGRNRDANVSTDPDFDPRYDGEPGIYSLRVRPGKQKVVDWGGMNWDEGPLGYSIDREAMRAKQEGYDSLRVQNITDEGRYGQGYGWGNETLVVFDPKNVRSVDADFAPDLSSSPNLMASIDPLSMAMGSSPPRSIDPLGYYSPTLEAALKLAQNKGTPEQMLAQLKKAGAKDSEIEVSGLKKMFEGKKAVTKDEIVKALEEGKVGINEVVYSRGENFDGELQRRLEEWREGVREMGRFQPERRGHRNGEFFERDQNIEQILPLLQEGRIPMDYDAIADDLFNAAGEFDRAGVKITQGVIPAWSDHHGYFYVVETPDGAAWMMADHDMAPVRYASKADAIADAEDGATRNNVRDMLQEESEVAARLRDEIEPDDPTRYSSYSLDPQNPTYREVVLHLPEKPRGGMKPAPHPDGVGFAVQNADGTYLMNGDAPARWSAERGAQFAIEQQAPRGAVTTLADFHSGHFDEPNIVGHMMVSETKIPGDPKSRVLTLDQVQSDWGQKLRDGGVRDEAKVAALKSRMAELDLAGKNERIADLAEAAGHKARGFRGAFDHDEVGKFLQGSAPGSDEARKLLAEIDAGRQEWTLLDAELRTAEAASPGHPLVNTTDQWLNTTLRRAIRMAAEEGQDYIAIPSGQTMYTAQEAGMGSSVGDKARSGIVSFYGGIPKDDMAMVSTMRQLREKAAQSPNEPIINTLGPRAIDTLANAGILDKKKIEGISTARVLKNAESRFQGIVPKNLGALLQKLDKNTPPPQVIDTLDSPSGATGLGQGFTLFRITPEAKKAAKEGGQPLFRWGGRVTR